MNVVTCLVTDKGTKFSKFTEHATALLARDYKGHGSYEGNAVICKIKSKKKKIIRQFGIDLCYVETDKIEYANAIAARYDAGIVKHRREHTGVLVVYE